MQLLLNREMYRRLALVLGLLLSIVMYTGSVGKVYEINKPDFEEMQEAKYKETLQRLSHVRKTIYQQPHTISQQLLAELQKQDLGAESVTRLPLEEFIGQQTRNNTRDISGTAWQPVREHLKEYFQGQTPEEWRINTANSSGRGKSLYFPWGEEPFASVSDGKLNEWFLAYDEAGSTQYFRLFIQDAKRASGAREALLYPWREYFWAPFVVGLALYLFVIPKVKRPQGALGYNRLWGVMISDFFSLVLGGACFLFGFLLLADNNASLAMLFEVDSSPLGMIFICWFLGLLFLSGLWFGVSYPSFWIRPLATGLEQHTATVTHLFPYAGMKQASLQIKKQHWLVQLILSLGAVSGGTAAMNASVNGRPDVGLVIEMHGEKDWRIPLREPDLGIALAKVLREKGVQLESTLNELLEDAQGEGIS